MYADRPANILILIIIIIISGYHYATFAEFQKLKTPANVAHSRSKEHIDGEL